jgi:hypothetical protein
MGRRELKDLATNVYKAHGDAIAGEQVIAQARTIGRAMLVPGTSAHRMREVVLKVNVLCVIDRPFRLVQPQMVLKM